VSKNFMRASVLALGLSAAASLTAQTTTSSGQTTTSSGQTTTSGTTATSSGQSTSSATLRDGKALIGATLSTTGGRYGTVSDLIFDGTGAVQYALVQRQGQLHPVPFSLFQFGSTGDATVSVSSASLDAVTVERNALQSLTDPSFGTRLRAAFGSNVGQSYGTSSTVPGFSTSADPAIVSARNQVFSLSGLLGGTINAQNGEAGSISTVAINPDGTLAYAVGVNSTGDTRFAVPMAVAQMNANANGLSVASPISTLSGVAVPQGSLPTAADQAFSAALTTAFGNRASSFVIGGNNNSPPNGQVNLVRNDPFNNDPVVRAGNSSQAGFDAVAGAGNPSRGGVDAVSRAGDRAGTASSASTTGIGTTSGSGTSAAGLMRANGNTGTTSPTGTVDQNPKSFPDPARNSVAGTRPRTRSSETEREPK